MGPRPRPVINGSHRFSIERSFSITVDLDDPPTGIHRMSDQAESDNLRRSKRKKFRLDVVAAAHGNNQKKSRRSGGGDDYDDVDMDDFDEDDEMMQQLNVTTDNDSMTEYVDDDEDAALSKRRTRRSTAVFQNYQQDTIGSWVENSGPYACAKCPSRYESKSSLANHNKMHTGEIRKFACELCDFSASTLKSLTHHNNVHKQFGVLSPQISPAVKAASTSVAASAVNGTSNGTVDGAATAMNTSLESTTSTSAPQLEVEVAEVTAPEIDDLEEVALEDGGPPLLDRQDEDDDGPPVLEREVSESPEPELPVRKSNRSAKPTQKKLEQKSRGPRGPYAKKIPKLELMETSGGSLPTSSASSVTPPPLRAESKSSSASPEPQPSTSTVTKKNNKSHKKKVSPPAPQKKKQLKKRKRCPRCPYTCTSTARLNRHFGGHRLREGFMCPVEKCHFMCRKPGFLPKHFILHKDATLAWPPKYCKIVGKRGAGERVKEVKSHQNIKKTSEVVEEKKKINKKQEASGKKRKLNVEEEKKQLEEIKKLQEKKRVHMMRQAQIKTHTKVQQDNVTYKKCNIAECDFQTVSMTQLIVHKTKVHGAKSAFAASHKFMCTTCGHRAKTYAGLRTHKLTSHLTAGRRFHRTFYLKEILGERFFIKYFADGKMPEESGEKKEKKEEKEEPVVVPEVVKEVTPPAEAVPTTSEVRMEEDEEDDGSGDESFDSISASTDVPPETLAAMNKKEVFFCCNMCPYKAPTMNRCQRHYAKHFTNDPFKCAHCSWSSRSREVIHSHQKLHEPPEEVVVAPVVVEEPKVEPKEEPEESKVEETSEDSKEEKEEKDSKKSPPKTVVFSEDLIASPIFAPLQKWCTAEKLKRPELNDQFSRKMIDGVKGFQCLDCPYTSKYRGDMRSHKKRHDIQQMYRCVQCTYTTNRPVSLKDHLKQHVALNKVNLENATSKKVVVNQGISIGHRKGAGKFRIYTCDQCPFTTLTVGCLWRHHRNHRSPARSNICSNCSYSSLEQRKMEEHTLIHLALGVGEPMPFVKRVDNKGRPVSSLTDLNSEKMSERKSNKRKATAVKEEEEEEEVQTTSQRVLRTPKAPKPVKEPKEKTPKKKEEKPPKPDGRKTRKQSLEPSPDPDYSIPGPSSQPTRQLSERATRNRINYSLLWKNGSGKPTPSSSSANLEKLGAVQEEEEPEEPLEVTHWRIRNFLNEEFASTKDPEQCPECPYKTDDPEVMSMHASFHSQKTHPRPYSCSDCTFNTYTPTALLQHLKLHSEGVCFDPSVNKRPAKHQRKGDYIPPGAKGFYCKNCSFKTVNQRSFVEHAAYHRHQLINRITITLKRQPPKEEYQRPKLKTQFVAKNAKYCKKCTFKCVSQNAYIEHLDRHGWNQLYKCYMCDYSDNNKSVVDFHQLTHHIVRDQTLHGINEASKFRIDNGQIQTPETSKPKPTPEEFVQKSRTLLKCPSCDYYCHVAEDLGFHMSVDHRSEDSKNKKSKKDDIKETSTRDNDNTISYLKMGLIPPKATVTIV